MPVTAIRTTVLRNIAGSDQDSDGLVDFGDVLRHTLVISNTTTNATSVVVDDPLNGSTLLDQPGLPDVNVSPLAFDDAYSAVGNTLLEVGNATLQTGPQSSVAGNILTNDVDFFSDTFTISAFDAASANGGTVSVVTNGVDAGSFTYVSAAGFTGTDTFTYTIRDDGLDGVAGNADDLVSTATVTITVASKVWYVDSSAGGGGTGTSTNPFNSLTQLNGVTDDGTTGDDVDGANDYIHVRGSATGAGLVLESGQQLIGTGTALVVGQTLLAATSNSSISDASGFTLTLGSGNTVSGINVISTAAASGTSGAITGTGFGTLTVSGVGVDGGSSQALILATGVIAGTGFTSTDSDGGTNNVSLTTVTGSLNLGSGALSGATGVGVLISAGNGSFDYNGTVTHTGNAVAIQVTGKTGGTVDFDGAVASNTASDGVSLTTNTGATINFDGGLVINTSSSNTTGFTASGGGTVSVTGASNSITSGTGTALDLNGVIVGATGLTLASVNNSGAASGVLLSSVTQAGGSTGIDINGGAIVNATSRGVDILSTSADVSIAATISTTAAGRSVEVTNSGSTAAGGNIITFSGAIDENGTGINLDNNDQNTNGAVVNFTGGLDIDSAAGQFGFNAVNGGTVNVTGAGNSIVTGTGIALNVVNTTIGASDLTFHDISANGAVNGIVLNNTGSSGGLTVTGTGTTGNSGGVIQNTTGDGIDLNNVQDVNLSNIRIFNAAGHGIDATDLRGVNTLTNPSIENWDSGGTATKNGLNIVNNNVNMTSMVVLNGTFNGSNTSNDGVFMEAQGSSSMSLRVDSVTFTDMFGDGVEMQSITGSTGTVNLRVWNSTFTNAAVLGNGGVQMDPYGDVNLFADIDGNTFDDIMRPVANLGAIGFTNGLTANADITIRNNTINDIDGSRGITGTATDTSVTRVLIDNNSIDRLGSNHAGISLNLLDSTSGDFTITNNDIGQAAALWTTGPLANNAILITTQDSTTGRVLINNNIISANTSSVLEVVRVRAIGTSTLNATVTNNTITDTDGTHTEFDATAGNTSVSGTINLNITGNNLDVGATTGVITLNEAGTGVLNVTQASAVAVTTANNGAVVTPDAGVAFGAATPPLPTTPTLPSAPLFVADPPPADVPADADGSAGTGPQGDLAPSGNPEPGQIVVDDGVISQAELSLIVDAAIQRWADAGASVEQIAAMRATTVSVADLGGLQVGAATPGTIRIDDNAGGWSWFIDSTPGDDAEYLGTGTRLTAADPNGQAGTRIDLLTAIVHELGHQIGLADSYLASAADQLMFGMISAGERRLPGADDAAAGDGTAVAGALQLTQIAIGTIPAGRSVTIMWDSVLDTYASNGLVPTFNNFSTVAGLNPGAFSVNSNTETLSTGSVLALDSLTLGGTVWNDNGAGGGIANNGIKDGTEAGISGVAVSLFVDANNNDVPDTPGVALATGLTSGSGSYSFTGLAPGNYIVRIDSDNFDAGGNISLVGLGTSPGSPDPDNSDPDTDNDDNGFLSSGAVFSNAITLAFNTEPTAGAGNDTNTTLDFGFAAFNQPPVNTKPGTQTINEDATLTFTGGTLISVNDPDVGAGNLTVTLSVAHGQLTLSGTAGLSFGTGDGTDDATMTFSGTQAAVNAALAGLLYEANTDFNGSDTLTIVTNDNGNTGADPGLTGGPSDEQDSDTVTINITAINDAPVVIGDGTESATTINEDAPSSTGQTVSSLFSGQYSDSADAQFGVGNPTGSSPGAFSGIAVTANGSSGATGQWQWLNGAVWTNIGTVSDASAKLFSSSAAFRFNPAPDFSGAAPTLTVHLIDNSLGFGIVNAQVVDISGVGATGGTTAYSTGTVVLSQSVTDDGLTDGTSGNDTIVGTPASDVFDLHQGGDDTVTGLASDDGFYMGAQLSQLDNLDGGPGANDQVGLQGNYGSPFVLGATNLTNIETLVLLPGNDTRFGDNAGNFYDYSLATVDANVGAGQVLTVNFNSLRVGEDVTFNGSAETDGSFLTYGGLGNDTLTGGAQSDGFYFGNNGRWGAGDAVNGGAGADDQLGLQGSYTVVFGAGQLTGIETIALLTGGDARFGNPPGVGYAYNLTMNNGNVAAGQTLIVNANTLRANVPGVTDETLTFNGAAELDGQFTVYGGAAADTITGGAGNDLIYGAGGADTLTGGAGNDTFAYTNAAHSTPALRDAITDFTLGDVIDLSAIDANTVLGGNDAFSFVGSAAFSNTAGELRFESAGGSDWLIQGDTDGNGVADFEILVTVTDANPITTDFVL